jgi:hypothetical protein
MVKTWTVFGGGSQEQIEHIVVIVRSRGLKGAFTANLGLWQRAGIAERDESSHYLNQVLPPALLEGLRALIASTAWDQAVHSETPSGATRP